MEQGVPFCNKTNVNYLIHGYSRRHIDQLSNNQYLPSSIINVIEYYYPKMNGHSFIWHITNYDTIQQLTNSQQVTSPSMAKQLSTIDSDVFDCGLSNKFFLQIQPHAKAVQFSSELLSNSSNNDDYNPWDDGPLRRRQQQTNSKPNQWGYLNNVQLGVSNSNNSSSSSDLRSSRGRGRGHRGLHFHQRRRSRSPPRRLIELDDEDEHTPVHDHEDENKVSGLTVSGAGYEEAKQDENGTVLVNLMAFPLPPKYRYVVFQCELYLHELGVEYSAIWNIKNINTIPDDIIRYIKYGWVIPCNLSRYQLNEMTFECKINVLKIIPEGYLNNANQQQAGLYSYDSVYDVQSLKKKLKFVWHISNYQGLVDKLTGSSAYKGIVQYHSDIYYDLFQLKLSRENDANQFKICVVGLPKDTHKMGVKMEVFAMDMSGKTDYDDNKIKIMSSIITFSYNSPTFVLSESNNETLIDLLMNYKQLRLLCTAQIIQKYDEQNNAINDHIKPIFTAKSPDKSESKNENSDEDHDDEEEDEENNAYTDLQHIGMEEIQQQIIESNKRFIELSPETFIWHITTKSDNGLLDKLKSAIRSKKKRTFNSGIFMLLGHRWYITVFTEGDGPNNNYGRGRGRRRSESRRKVRFFLNCLTKSSVACKVNFHLLQTGNKMEFYDSFESHNWGRPGWRSPTDNGRYMLAQNENGIKTLNEITFKVDVSVIAEYGPGGPPGYLHNMVSGRTPKGKQTNVGGNDDTKEEEEENGISKEVVQWLTETVKLPDYIEVFEEHAIDDMNIVKMLNIEALTKMGIMRIGHQLKILHQIDVLQQKQD